MILLGLVALLWWQDRRSGEPAPLTWETCEQWGINCR